MFLPWKRFEVITKSNKFILYFAQLLAASIHVRWYLRRVAFGADFHFLLSKVDKMVYGGTVARRRRFWNVLRIVVPLTLKILLTFITDSSELDGSLANDRPTGGKVDASLEVYTKNSPAGELYGLHSDDHHELSQVVISEFIKTHANILRKQRIHTIVTIGVTILFPFMAFFYASLFLGNTREFDRSTNSCKRRTERILSRLQECRVQLPNMPEAKNSTTAGHENRRECPICLSDFAAGEIVIAPKHCACSIRTATATCGNEELTSASNGNNEHTGNRSYYHEKCIATWLSQRKSNPRKTCPCCRQPFLPSIRNKWMKWLLVSSRISMK